MKRILITGVAGFIGTNLALKFLKEGHIVYGIDNLSSGQEGNIKLLEEEKNKGKHFYYFLLDVEDLDKFVFNFSIDEIYHLACPASPPKYQKDPISTLMTSIRGTYNVLNLANRFKCKVLFTSTSEIYGEPQIHPQPESYRGNVNTVGPRSCYDEGKTAAETLCYEFRKQYEVDVKIIRIFNTYGPYMDPNDGRVVTNFINMALLDNTISIYGDGTQTRSFQYIDDLINGIIKMMESEEGGPINIGNPVEFTVNELATIISNKIEKITNKKPIIKYSELPSDDPTQRKPDITLAKSLLNWEPIVPLDEGLDNTIKFFLSNK